MGRRSCAAGRERCGSGARLLVWDKIPERGAAGGGVRGRRRAPIRPLTWWPRPTFVIVVVKPKDGDELLRSLAPLLRDGQIVVSSMAGVELEQHPAAGRARARRCSG